jgi:hypothetical protein
MGVLTDHSTEHLAIVGPEGVGQELRLVLADAPGVAKYAPNIS